MSNPEHSKTNPQSSDAMTAANIYRSLGDTTPEPEHRPTQPHEALFDRVEQLRQGLSFPGVSRDTMPVIRTIESQAYPRDYHLFKGGYLKELLSQEGADEFSFVIAQPQPDGANYSAMGYCIASYGESETPGVPDTSSIELHNFAMLPEQQGTGAALAGFAELLDRAARNNISTISADMRASTSYPLIMRSRKLIEKGWGYSVEEIPDEDPDQFDNSYFPDNDGFFESELEKDHRIVLRRLSNHPSPGAGAEHQSS